MNISKILKNTNLIFSIAIFIGFIYPNFADGLKIFLIPSLITMMSFSLMNFRFRDLQFDDLKHAAILTGLNMVVLGGMYILLAFLLVDVPIYRNALIVAGVMPPAVGIISLTYILDGDLNTGFIAEVAGYIISLFVIPATTILFFGEAVTITQIVRIILLVIVSPFIISRLLVWINSRKQIIPESTTEIIVNLCYGLLFYITIGVNIDVFMNNFLDLINLFVIFIILRFGLGVIIYFILRKRISADKRALYILFGTFKNGSAGMAITVMLFGIKATVPFAIFSIIASFYIMFLKWFLD